MPNVVIRPRTAVLLAFLLALAALLPGTAFAGATQSGAPMVIINSGGGTASDGANGIAIVLNGYVRNRSNAFMGQEDFAPYLGGDNLFFGGTHSWQGPGSGPVLVTGYQGLGGTMFGAGGAAKFYGEDWTSVQVLETTGSAIQVASGTGTLPATLPTGSGSATIRYTATVGGHDYVVDRHVAYVYPETSYTDRYTVTVPDNAADPGAMLYVGGYAQPGGWARAGSISSLLAADHTMYSMNRENGVYLSLAAVGAPFTGGWTANPGSAGHAMEEGIPFPGDQARVPANCDTSNGATIVDGTFCVESAYEGFYGEWVMRNHGTFVHEARFASGLLGQTATASFEDATLIEEETTHLDIHVRNTAFDTASGLELTFALPAGVTITGHPTNTCDGEVSTNATTVSLTGGSVAGSGTCTIRIPVTAAVGTHTVHSSTAFSLLQPGSLKAGATSSTLTVTAKPAGTHLLAVTVAGEGKGSVTSTPTGITCGATCEHYFAHTKEVTLHEHPADGSIFTGWHGACTGLGACHVSMSQKHNVSAHFQIKGSAIAAAEIAAEKNPFAILSDKPVTGKRKRTIGLTWVVSVPSGGSIEQTVTLKKKGTKKPASRKTAKAKSLCRVTRITAVAGGWSKAKPKGAVAVPAAGKYAVTCSLAKRTRAKLRKRGLSFVITERFTPNGGNRSETAKLLKVKRSR